MSTYYGPRYNSYGLDRPIHKGDKVEVLDPAVYGDLVLGSTVMWTGTVEALRLTRVSEGYTVLVRVTDTVSVWARPDELRQVRS